MLLSSVALLWPVLSKFARQALGTHIGDRIFELFNSPSADQYLQATDNCLTLKVVDDEDTNKAHRGELFSLQFRRLPDTVRLQMEYYISPSAVEMQVLGSMMLIPSVLGVFEPVVMLLGTSGTVIQAFFFFEQIVVGIIRYYDFCGRSVNTKFGGSIRDVGLYEGT